MRGPQELRLEKPLSERRSDVLSAVNGAFYNDQYYMEWKNGIEWRPCRVWCSGGRERGRFIPDPGCLCRKGVCRNEVTGGLGYF